MLLDGLWSVGMLCSVLYTTGRIMVGRHVVYGALYYWTDYGLLTCCLLCFIPLDGLWSVGMLFTVLYATERIMVCRHVVYCGLYYWMDYGL